MSTPYNEIARLCRITPPDVAVELVMLRSVHIEHLGTIERIQQAKAELVEGMKQDGIAVLNADDFRVLQMRELSKKAAQSLTGSKNEAEVMAKTSISSVLEKRNLICKRRRERLKLYFLEWET